RPVGGILVLEDALLGGDVGFHAAVPVEVVGSDVEHDSSFRMEGLNGLKLEAGDFEHVVGVGGGFGYKRNCRGADVAADQRLPSAPGDDLAGEGSGGGLSVGAGDGDDVALKKARGELDLADDRNAALAGLSEQRDVAGNAGTDHDQVLLLEGALAVTPGFDGDAAIEQLGNFPAELVFSLGVGDGDAGALLFKEERGGDTGASESDHEHALAFDVEGLRHRAISSWKQLFHHGGTEELQQSAKPRITRQRRLRPKSPRLALVPVRSLALARDDRTAF